MICEIDCFQCMMNGCIAKHKTIPIQNKTQLANELLEKHIGHELRIILPKHKKLYKDIKCPHKKS